MGVVYEAEQDNPRRPVALKVLRPGLVSPALLRRFAGEAHILGRLHHPGIAAIYEAGVADDGQPFFALEYVRGVALDEYARRHGLDGAARLGLLARVCDAVQHAHEQGVIHRDLKPSNILVDEAGQPKVLDFGVARTTDADLLTNADRTRTGQLVGTLSYMSPEQVATEPAALDRCSDVYTLGVILFELLTGRLPYPLEHLPLPEAARVIREQEPARLGALDARCRGDIETIVGKALEKDPARRYPSAAEVAADIRRHLRHEPIRARPPSALYQLGKFARRHKALVATTATFLALLLLAGALAAWQAVRLAHSEADQARQQAKRSRDVQDALARAAVLREQARRTSGDPGPWAQALAEARRARARLEDGPVEAGLADQVGDLLRELDEEEADRRLVARLEEVRLRVAAEADARKRSFAWERALPEYRKVFADYGLRARGAEPAEAAARIRRRPPGVRGQVVAALDTWLMLARPQKAPEASWLERVLAAADPDDWRQRLRVALGRRDRQALVNLAREVKVADQPPQALTLLGDVLGLGGSAEDAVGLLRRAWGAYPGDFWISHELGYYLRASRPPQLDEAITFHTVAVALRPRSAPALLNLGIALAAKGRWDRAIACDHKAIELDPNLALAHNNLGDVLTRKGRLDEAIASFRKAIELDPNVSGFHSNLGAALNARGQIDDAIASDRKAIALDPQSPTAHNSLGAALAGKGQLNEAIAEFREALRLQEDYALARRNLALALRLKGLTDRLPAVLAGKDQPRDAAERLDFADLCQLHQRRYAAAARFYAEAFTEQPTHAANLQAGHRYQAACAAALAGCGQGQDAAGLGPEQRLRWRRQALTWLSADLRAWQGLLAREPLRSRPVIAGQMRHWLKDPDFNGVRGEQALGWLPAEERAAWAGLWADVAGLLDRTKGRTPTDKEKLPKR
jgi:tetratricopeptide (TPR) repeat protein